MCHTQIHWAWVSPEPWTPSLCSHGRYHIQMHISDIMQPCYYHDAATSGLQHLRINSRPMFLCKLPSTGTQRITASTDFMPYVKASLWQLYLFYPEVLNLLLLKTIGLIQSASYLPPTDIVIDDVMDVMLFQFKPPHGQGTATLHYNETFFSFHTCPLSWFFYHMPCVGDNHALNTAPRM